MLYLNQVFIFLNTQLASLIHTHRNRIEFSYTKDDNYYWDADMVPLTYFYSCGYTENYSPYIIAEHISDWQIIVQQVWRYSRVLVCMYIRMSAKNSGLLIVGL